MNIEVVPNEFDGNIPLLDDQLLNAQALFVIINIDNFQDNRY